MIYWDDILLSNHTYKYHINSITQALQIDKENKLWHNKTNIHLSLIS